MPIDLTKPLSWKNATHDEQRMLRALQGNILKGHGRPATVNIFFKIDAAKKHQMRAALREIANYHATSAYQQLIETDNFHATGNPAILLCRYFSLPPAMPRWAWLRAQLPRIRVSKPA